MKVFIGDKVFSNFNGSGVIELIKDNQIYVKYNYQPLANCMGIYNENGIGIFNDRDTLRVEKVTGSIKPSKKRYSITP